MSDDNKVQQYDDYTKRQKDLPFSCASRTPQSGNFPLCGCVHNNKITTEREDIVTKERLKKELSKVDDQLAGLQARKKDLEEQLQMAEDAEKMKFIEKNKISLDRLALLNKVSEEEILSLLKQKEKEQAGQAEKEAGSHEEKQVIN